MIEKSIKRAIALANEHAEQKECTCDEDDYSCAYRDVYHDFVRGYQAGMQDPDANKKPYNVIYGDEENLYRLYCEMEKIAGDRFKKIEELQEKYNQAMKDWSMDAIKKTEVIVKLEAENKKLREALNKASDLLVGSMSCLSNEHFSILQSEIETFLKTEAKKAISSEGE